MELRLQFYQKMSAHDENCLEICISTPWGPYYISARHFDVVHKFLGVLKIIEFFGSKSKGVSFWFYRNMSARDEN
jgi:hypothetical protein